MNTTNAVAQHGTNAPVVDTSHTLIGKVFSYYSGHDSSAGMRLLLIAVLVVALHIMLRVIRFVSEWIINKSHAEKNPLGFVTQEPKFITFIQLVTSGVIFVMYFLALGLALEECGVELTQYLASATIIGLAISFGSQGLVQDVVISLTLIFSDAMDVGDMVEIAGAVVVIGRVEEIGLRFTTLRNLYNQTVFIPNRTIANVSRFPHGGVLAYADIQIPKDGDEAKAVKTIRDISLGLWSQFGAIILSEPTISPVESVSGAGWKFLRVHFKIWPGQGSLIETTFRQQIVSALKAFSPAYADWQVPVTYRAMVSGKSSQAQPTATAGKPEPPAPAPVTHS